MENFKRDQDDIECKIAEQRLGGRGQPAIGNSSRKGKLIGPKRPFNSGDVWEIRQFLKLKKRTRDLALFDLGIDAKLRACDLLDLRVSDVASAGQVFD